MYKLTIIKTDGTETEEEVSERPSFKKVYALINTDMIQIVKGYDKHRAKRPFEMWIDEDAKMKKKTKKNNKATTMWYDYLQRTNASALFGDVIYGDVALVMTKDNAIWQIKNNIVYYKGNQGDLVALFCLSRWSTKKGGGMQDSDKTTNATPPRKLIN